jgi:putative DNA primase/helicase
VTDAARHYIERLGWSLVSIEPGSKGPRTPGWQRSGIRDLEAARLHWEAHPDHGLGLLHAESGTAALDADADGDTVALALAAVGIDYVRLLERPGPALVGNPAKPAKLLYRLLPGLELPTRKLAWPDPENPAALRVVFELRAGRVQDVLPPTFHPGTGEPYRWISEPARPEDVPYLPGALAALWLAWREREPALRSACPWAPPPPPRRAEFPNAARRPRGPGEPSVIETYNARVAVASVLERNGYRERGGRWIAPGSTTGTPGVVVLEGRAYSHHASDALADGYTHDAFGALTLLEHNGDVGAALQSAREELGI